MQDFYLSVADFNFHIQSDSNFPMVLEEGYESFVCEQKTEKLIEIQVFDSLPEIVEKDFTLVYSAENLNLPFWNIYQFKKAYRLEIFSQTKDNQIQQIAEFNLDASKWKIYCTPIELESEKAICPLQYPLGPLIWYYIALNNNAIMIHASGINFNNVGRIFSGFSGKGKSTMAKIWQECGAKVINDDRILFREIGNDFYIYNTPMFYEAKPKSSILNRIYFPYHSLENKIQKLSKAETFKNLYSFIIQHGFESSQIEKNMSLLERISEKIPAYQIGFFPDEKIVDFIQKNENL